MPTQVSELFSDFLGSGAAGGFMRGVPPLPPSASTDLNGGSKDLDGGVPGGPGGPTTVTAAGPNAPSTPSAFPPGVHRELSLILKEIRVITDKIRDDEDTAAIENDWKFAAMVLDRLCLITFTLFTIIATIAVLLSAPHIIVT